MSYRDHCGELPAHSQTSQRPPPYTPYPTRKQLGKRKRPPGLTESLDLVRLVAQYGGVLNRGFRLQQVVLLVNPPQHKGPNMANDIPDDTIYARDLDGTGSAHICSKGDPGAHEYTRTATITRTAPKVKPLVWGETMWGTFYSEDGLYRIRGEDGGGSYHISYSTKPIRGDNGVTLWFDDIDSAKFYAEKDHERRILSALE